MTKRAERKLELQSQAKDAKKFFAIKLGSLFLFIILLAANIYVFAQSVSLSDKLVEVEIETQELKKENSRLEQELITHTSLSNLEELADQLGFTKSMEPITLDVNEYAQVP